MKKVTNKTARLITLNAGTLSTGVSRLRIPPGATVKVTDEVQLEMLENDTWVQAIMDKGMISVVDSAADDAATKANEAKAAKKKAAAEKKVADAAAKKAAKDAPPPAAPPKAPPPPPAKK